MSSTAEILGRHYKSLVKIGEGAMGEVWKGTDPFLERDVALKLMRSELASQPDAVERFRNEAVSTARLNHPNIVPLYDFVQEDGISWMVLEYVHGCTLETLVAHEGRLDWRRAVLLTQQALRGLERAHAAGIVHRDIKPANAMLADDGTLKLMDFGIARISQTTRLTRVGHAVGTVAYMAPEQILGQEADARADLYALGVVLFELISGRLPIAGETEAQIIRQHVDRTEAPRLSSVVPGVPAALESVVAKALSKDPARRYTTAAEFRRALEAIDVPAAGPAPRPPWHVLGASVAGVLVVAALGVGAVLNRGADAPSPQAEGPRLQPQTTVAPVLRTPDQRTDVPAPTKDNEDAPAPRVASSFAQAMQQCAERVAEAREAIRAGQAARAAELAREAKALFSECEGAHEVLQEVSTAKKREPVVPERRVEMRPAPLPTAPAAPTPSVHPTGPARTAVVPSADVLSGARLACTSALNDSTRAQRRGDTDAARRHLQRALNADPSCPGADRLQRILDAS